MLILCKTIYCYAERVKSRVTINCQRSTIYCWEVGKLLACPAICLCKGCHFFGNVFIRARGSHSGEHGIERGHGRWYGTWRWKYWYWYSRSTRWNLGTAPDLRRCPMNSMRSERSASRPKWIRARFFAHAVGEVTWKRWSFEITGAQSDYCRISG
jgi:hypothetical protein